ELMVPKYVFEMKLSLLQRVALSENGAQQLLQHNLIESLGDMDVLHEGVNLEPGEVDMGSSLPSAEQRYHDVLIPTLSLVVTVLGGCGKSHDALTRVGHFVMKHRDIFSHILQDKGQRITLASLEALKWLTAIFAYLAGDRKAMEKPIGSTNYGSLLVALLNKYMSPSKWESKLHTTNEVEVERKELSAQFLGRPSAMSLFRQDAEKHVQEICRNLLSYCTGVTTVPAPERFLPLFDFSFEGADLDGRAGSSTNKAPSLGSICRYAANHMEALLRALDDYQNVSNKLLDVESLPLDEINEIIRAAENSMSEVGPSHKRQWARLELRRAEKEKRKQAALFLYALEHTLLLIWRHLKLLAINPNVAGSTTRGALGDLKVQIGEVLGPVLQKVDGLGLIEGIKYSGDLDFLKPTARKLQDLLVEG
ncbi:hypothetical protein HK097_008703, partial [Rhizophlyctis rosea]